jgi:hypothetical protein
MRQVLTVVAFLCAFTAFAQMPGAPSQREMDQMKRLEFMVGRWEGSGWVLSPDGTRQEFKGVETVQRKLQGRALLVEGRFEHDGVVSHETLGVLTFNEPADGYRLRVYLFNGPHGEHRFEALEEGPGFRWFLEFGEMRMRYTTRITPEGEWHEVGEVLREGETPLQFFEMRLKRAAETRN